MSRYDVANIVDFLVRLAGHPDREQIIEAVLDGASVKDSHRKGVAWEETVEQHARGLGYTVEPGNGRNDMIINGWRVQCKHVDEERNGKVCISNMRPVKANGGFRGYLVENVDVFCIQHRGLSSVIPVREVTTDGIKVDQHVSTSKLKQYAERWDLFMPPGDHGSGQRELFA